MENKTLKRLMTDLAKGNVTQKEVDNQLKSIKVAGTPLKTSNNTHKRKLNAKGGKK